MSTFRVTLRTPTKTLFEGKAQGVNLSTDLGRMEVLPNHATLVGTILYSKVLIKSGGTSESFTIRQGSLSVNDKGEANILADDGQKEGEFSVESMQDYLSYLVQQLKEKNLNEYQIQFMEEQRKALQAGIDESKK